MKRIKIILKLLTILLQWKNLCHALSNSYNCKLKKASLMKNFQIIVKVSIYKILIIIKIEQNLKKRIMILRSYLRKKSKKWTLNSKFTQQRTQMIAEPTLMMNLISLILTIMAYLTKKKFLHGCMQTKRLKQKGSTLNKLGS